MSGSSSMDRILAQQGDLDLKNVSEKDQAELAQRLAAEMKRLEVQNRMFFFSFPSLPVPPNTTHALHT
jgi:hypothetical protein